MTSGESSLRMPKEATCDVECAMKVESLRILSKKRKQSQRGDGSSSSASPKGGGRGAGVGAGAGGSGGGDNPAKGIKRSLSSSLGPGSPSGKNSPSLAPSCDSASSASSAGSAGSAGVAPIPSKEGSFDGGMTMNSASKDAKDSARRRFVWSVPLHQDFVAAVFDVGLKCASPKLLLEMMPVVDGLTSEHIKSHLQKYRLHRQRSREEFLKSYGYLTDLDGGKGLGGGSAAATIKAAASAAAADVKVPFAGCGPDRPQAEPEEKGCASSCGCNDNDDSSLGGGGAPPGAIGDGKDEESNGKGGPEAAAAAAAGAAGASEGVAGSKGMASAASGACAGGDGLKKPCGPEGEGKKACAGSAGARPADAVEGAVGGEASQPKPGDVGAVQTVTSAMLQSHLELLARGIDLQVKFHHHLREVVESQQTLQVQLLGKQGGPLPPHLIDTGSPRELTNAAEMATPTVIGFPRIGQQQAGGGRLKESNQVPKSARSVGAAGSLAGVRNNPGGARQSAAASGSPWVVSGGDDISRGLASAGRAHGAVDAKRSKGPPPGAVGGDSRKKQKAMVTDAPGSTLPGPAVPSPSLSGPALSSPALSGPSLSSPALSGPALPGPALPGPALSGPSLSSPSLSGPSISGPALSGPGVSSSARARAASGSPRNNDSTGGGDSRGKTGNTGQPPPLHQMGPSSMRASSFPAHAATGGQSLPQRFSAMGRQGASIASRGYVPGEFTLISKSSETAAGGGSSHARGSSEAMKMGAVGRGGVGGAAGAGGVGVGGGGGGGGGGGFGEGRAHAGVSAARNPAEARAALAAAGLVPAAPTGPVAQETSSLRRHMQAQMEVHQSMLEACVDQATHFGSQRTWMGGGGAPPLRTFGGVGGEAGGTHSQRRGEEAGGNEGRHGGGGGDGGGGSCGGAGGGGGGARERATAGVGNREQRVDAPSMPAPDSGESSALMGLLQPDEDLDFGLLDRGGELRPGDNPPLPRHHAGEEFSSLFSFLMD